MVKIIGVIHKMTMREVTIRKLHYEEFMSAEVPYDLALRNYSFFNYLNEVVMFFNVFSRFLLSTGMHRMNDW